MDGLDGPAFCFGRLERTGMVSRILILVMISVLVAPAAFSPAQEGAAPPDSVGDIITSDLSDEDKISALNELILLNPRNADLYNNLGVIYAEREDWVLARDSFIAAIQCDPRLPQSHRNLGMVMAALDEPAMAVAEFEAYQRFSPDRGLDAHKMIGDAWRAAGAAPFALESYRNGLEAYGGMFGPGSAELIMAQALLLDETNADEDYEALLRKYADPARDYLASTGGEAVDPVGRAAQAISARLLRIFVDDARLMGEAGSHAEAAQVYEAAMALAPDNDDLLPLASAAWFDAGETMKAKVLAQRATMESPERPGGWQARGRIAEVETRSREAIEHYRKAWDLDPTQNDVAAKIGQLYLSLGDNANARKFMGLVASDPDTPPELLYNYALSLQRADDHELALHPLRKVVERRPEMATGWRALASSLRHTKRYDEAARAYGKAFALDNDPKLAFQQGYCYQRTDKPVKAADAYRLSLAMDPTNARTHYNLGLVLIKVGEYRDALETFAVLDDLEPDSYRIRFNTGLCHQHLAEHDEALTAYELALDIEETSAVWNNMGLVYDAMGDKIEAKECYEEGKRLKAEGQ